MKKIVMLATLFVALIVFSLGRPQAVAAANDCTHFWANADTIEFKPGFWTVGTHTYQYKIIDPSGTFLFPLNQFQVDNNALLLDGQVLLRLVGLRSSQGAVTTINPAQDTAGLVLNIYTDDSDNPLSRKDAEAAAAQTIVQISWDGGPWITLNAGPLKSSCALMNGGFFERSWGRSY